MKSQRQSGFKLARKICVQLTILFELHKKPKDTISPYLQLGIFVTLPDQEWEEIAVFSGA